MRMKKTAVIIVLLMALMLCFGVPVGAADPDYYAQNVAEITDKYDKLESLMNEYADTAINSEITPYASAITLLRGDSRINTEDLTDEIYMYYVKGRVAGKCAWVYVSYSPSLGEDELVEVETKYKDILNSIRGNSDISDLEEKESVYPLNIMKEIYVQRIGMLYDSTDSQQIALLAYSYELKINEISEFDETEFETIYNRAKTDIEIQRARELAQESFTSLYDGIYGDGAYAQNTTTDKTILSFVHAIGESASVSEFNADLKDAANSLLAALFEGRDGEYSQALLTALTNSVADTVTAADAWGEIADDWSMFDGIRLDMAIAGAKDTLLEYVTVASADTLDGMSDLVAEYNSEGGIFDNCANEQEVETELGKAKLRADWLIYIRRAESKIKGIYGTHNATSDLNKLGELYSPYDSAIKSKATMGAAQDALTEAKAAADKIVSDVSALLEEERKNAQSRIDGALQSYLYDMKHEIKYLGNADEIIASMREKHSGRTAELKAAQSLSELDDIVSAVCGELEALYADAESANLAAAIAANTKKIRDKESSAKAEIADKSYLDDATVYTEPLTGGANTAAADIALMSDISQIEQRAAEYERYADGVLESAEAENAENERIYLAREAAKDALTASRDDAFTKLGELKYLSEDESGAIKTEIESAYSLYFGKIESEANTDGISARLTEGKDAIDASLAEASLLNTENARGAIKAELLEKFESFDESDYSKENYSTVQKAYNDAVEAIDAGKSIGEFIAARDNALRLMSSVVSEFDAARNAAKKKLTDAYAELIENSERYSEENLEKLNEVYQHTLGELEQFDKSLGEEAMNKTVDERIKIMRDIRVDWINSGNIGISSGSSSDYPAGHDTSADKLWGVVSGSDGLYSDISLSITEKDIQKSHKDALKSVLERSRIAYVGDNPLTDADIARILEDSDIKAVYDIKLIRDGAVWSDFGGRYTVRILLPKSMRDIDRLRAVYISEDGSAEYYDAERDGAFLVFETEHFSEFIIVGEKTVNLLPIIIILGVIALAEGVLAAVLTMTMKKKQTLLSVAAMPILGVIAPRGGLAIVIILAVLDIALGAYIAFCAVRILASHRAEQDVEDEQNETPYLPEVGEDFADEAEPVLHIETLDAVSAEEADTLVSDSQVEEIIVKEDSPEIFRGKKAFINVDTISDNFEAGETVTLKELKEKRLVARNVCYVKILARGVINKPLTVKAQSFSANAVKMIALTGGTAVIEGNGDYIVS